MISFMTEQQMENYFNYMMQVRRKCKCGHTIIMPEFVDKQLCDWCHKLVFKNKRVEFEYRLKEAMRRA